MLSEKLTNAMRWFDQHIDDCTPDMIDQWRRSIDAYIREVQELENTVPINPCDGAILMSHRISPNAIEVARILDREGVGVGRPKAGWRISRPPAK